MSRSLPAASKRASERAWNAAAAVQPASLLISPRPTIPAGRPGSAPEAQPTDGDFSTACHWANGRRGSQARVARADDAAGVGAPGVAQPAAGPAAKQDQAARLGIPHPGSILPAAGLLCPRRCWRAPLLTACIQHPNGAQVLQAGALAKAGKNFVKGHTVHAGAHVVADLQAAEGAAAAGGRPVSNTRYGRQQPATVSAPNSVRQPPYG